MANKNHHIDLADRTSWENKVNRSGDTMTGALTMNANLTVSGGNLTIGATRTLIHGATTIINTASRVQQAVYNDLAEWMIKDDPREIITPGDVVFWGENGITKYIQEVKTLIVGVYSDTYGFILGADEDDPETVKNYVPVGIAGRVSVKATGNIQKGDLLSISNIPGVAAKSEFRTPGTVIGKALEDHFGDSVERISMLICNI